MAGDLDNWDLMPGGGGVSFDDPSVDNWDLMPDPSSGPINDPWATEPGYEGSPATSLNLGGGGGGGGGGMGNLGATLGKLLGLTGKDGNLNSGGLLQLLSMLGIGAGGIMSHNATKDATNQMMQGLKDSNAAVTGILQPQMDSYKPYTQAGTQAVGNLQNIGYKPMAQNFKPIGGQPSGVTLGNMVRR